METDIEDDDTPDASVVIDHNVCRMIEGEIRVAMDIIAAKHGLVAITGGGRFSSSEYKPKVEFKVKGELSASKGNEDNFKSFAKLYGLDPEWLGKTFIMQGKAYKVVGLAPRRSKNCVMILRLKDNSQRVCSPEYLKMGTMLKA